MNVAFADTAMSVKCKMVVYQKTSSVAEVFKLFTRLARFDIVEVSEGQQPLMILFCTIKMHINIVLCNVVIFMQN